jgi:hypothetical protein
MAELTPARAAEAHELLKKLLKHERSNTRKLKQVLEELTGLAEEREDIDHQIGDIIYGQLSDDQDQEMVRLALEGLDMQQLITVIGRSGRPKGQLKAILDRFRIIRDMRVHGRGREENAKRNRDHIILGVGGAGGSHAGDGIYYSYSTSVTCPGPSGGGGGTPGS